MMPVNLKPEDRDQYDKRFQKFLAKIIKVAGYTPRRKYLYPLMEGVPFRDLEVALDITVAARAKNKSNDNDLN